MDIKEQLVHLSSFYEPLNFQEEYYSGLEDLCPVSNIPSTVAGPEKPENVAVKFAGGTSLKLTWSKPKVLNEISNYVIEYKPTSDSEWKETRSTGTKCHLNGLKADCTYEFRVRARIVCGLSEASEVVRGKLPSMLVGEIEKIYQGDLERPSMIETVATDKKIDTAIFRPPYSVTNHTDRQHEKLKREIPSKAVIFRRIGRPYHEVFYNPSPTPITPNTTHVLAQKALGKRYHTDEAHQDVIQMKRRKLQKIDSHMDARGYPMEHEMATDSHAHPSIDFPKLKTKSDQYNPNERRSHSDNYTKEARSTFRLRMKSNLCSSSTSQVSASPLEWMRPASVPNNIKPSEYHKSVIIISNFRVINPGPTVCYTATETKPNCACPSYVQRHSKPLDYFCVESTLPDRHSDLKQIWAEQSRESGLALFERLLCWSGKPRRAISGFEVNPGKEHELSKLRQVELLQSSERVKECVVLSPNLSKLSYDFKTLSEVSESSKSDSILKSSKPIRKCDLSDTTWLSVLETPETLRICDINLTHCTLFASDLFKPSFLCMRNDADLLFVQYEWLQKLVVSETTCVVNKTRCADNLDSGTALQDKPSEVLAATLLNDYAVSANSIQSSSSLVFEQDCGSYDFEGAFTKSRNTMFAEKKRSIPEYVRYEYAEAAIRSMQYSLQKSFLLLAVSFISMAGLCGACQTILHERSSCEVLFPLQETTHTNLCNFGSRDFAGIPVRRDMSPLLELEHSCCCDINGSLYRDRASYLYIPLKVNLAISGNDTYPNDGNSSTRCMMSRSRRGISITCFMCPVNSSDAGLGISRSTHSQYDRCQEICDPSIMKMRCNKFCENLTAEENRSTNIFTVKMIILVACVLLSFFGRYLIEFLIRSKYDQAMMTNSTESCGTSQVQNVEKAIVENQINKYQSAEDLIREPTTAKLLQERDIVHSEPDLDQDKVTRICTEASADVQMHEHTNVKIPENVSKTLIDVQMHEDTNVRIPKNVSKTLTDVQMHEDTDVKIPENVSKKLTDVQMHEGTDGKISENVSKTLTDVKERVKDDQVGKFQSDVDDILKRQMSQEETERHPKHGMEVSGQIEVSAAVFSKTACPLSSEEEEELSILPKCYDLMEEGFFDRTNETVCKTLVDCCERTRIEVGKHSLINNINNSKFQMRQRVDFDTKLSISGCAQDFFTQCSGLIQDRTDSSNAPSRALCIPDLAMSEQPRGNDKAISQELACKTFDRHNISHRMSPKNRFKDDRFRMIVFDETASEIQNKDRVNELRRFSPLTSAGRDHQLDRGSPKYCPGENLKGNDAEDDCHVLRQMTWLPLNELPVPDIYTCITVHSAAQVILNRIASGERVGAQESMKFEILRVCTFRNYPSADKPFRILFSIAGMYYASDRDEVVCYSCGLRKAGWKETDIPVDVHKKITPNCRFLVNNSAVNIPIPELEGSQLEKFKILEDLLSSNERPRTQQAEITGGSHGNFDLNTSQSPQYRFFVPPPKHPQYAVQSVRLDTFKGWPTNIPQTPQIMAECGYYYAGFGDCVRCFHCGIGLRHWTEDDYPWIEHARWSKDCAYLRQVKGEEFIQNVHLAIDQDEEPEDLIPATASGQPADMSQVTPNDDSNQILLTDPAQSVLEMGYQPRTIKKAIDIILRSEGRSGINAEKIMETIFMLEERSDNLEQEVANITISGASSEAELQLQNGSEGSHNEATDENEKNCSADQPPTNRSTGQNSSSNQTQRNSAKGQAPNRNAGDAQRSSEVKTQVQKGTYAKSDDKGHAKSDLKKPSNRVTKNEDAASPKSSPHSSLDEKSKGATGTSSTSRDTSKIKAENQKLKEQTICKVCLDKPVSIVFLPCGHLVTCAECAPAMKKCPICRGIVKGMVKAFMS